MPSERMRRCHQDGQQLQYRHLQGKRARQQVLLLLRALQGRVSRRRGAVLRLPMAQRQTNARESEAEARGVAGLQHSGQSMYAGLIEVLGSVPLYLTRGGGNPLRTTYTRAYDARGLFFLAERFPTVSRRHSLTLLVTCSSACSASGSKSFTQAGLPHAYKVDRYPARLASTGRQHRTCVPLGVGDTAGTLVHLSLCRVSIPSDARGPDECVVSTPVKRYVYTSTQNVAVVSSPPP